MRNLATIAAVLAAVMLSACGSGSVTPGTAGASQGAIERSAALRAFIRPGSKRIVVQPGQSIQAAVDAAKPGDTILVEPGTYHEKGRTCPFRTAEKCAVSITKSGITLVGDSGSSAVVLNNPSGLSIGIGIGKYYTCNKSYRITNSVVVGFTVTGFKDSGILATCVTHWEMAYDLALNNKIYDFYPVWASEGRLHNSVATGATDTGFYVGISQRVRVDHNVAYNNVSGYEFENTIDSLMDHNTAYNNTGGILEFIIPGDPKERSYGNSIRDNVVTANNNANKCTGGVVCTVPPGTGILDIGGHDNETVNNMVTNNKQWGLALTDVCTAFGLSPKQCKALKYDPLPERTRIVGNTSLHNGTDIVWFPQNGKGNCWSGNRAHSKAPSKLPKCK